jgi:peroxiredoxin
MRYLFILLMGISYSVASWTQGPGKVIPAFQFATLDGAVFNQTNLASGKMSLFVFVDTDCDHCQHAMQYINQHHKEFKKVAIYLVSMANPARINQFMNSFGKNLINQKHVVLLQDTRYDFISKFKPQKYPGMFLYSADKKLLLYGDDEKKINMFSKKIKAGG